MAEAPKKVFFLKDYVILNKLGVLNNGQCSNTSTSHEEEPGDGENLDNLLISEHAQAEKTLSADENFTWSQQAVNLLLDEYHKRLLKFRNPKFKKKLLWEEIAQEMRKYQYEVDATMLDRKMRNLKSTYCKIKDNNQSKRTGRGKIHWEFFNKFDDIFAIDKTVNITNCISSLPAREVLTIDVNANASNAELAHSPLTSPTYSSNDERGNSSNSNSRERQKKLDCYRKKHLELEKERLEEVKKIRMEIEESNKINREKLDLFKKYIQKINKD